jgi:hypothetical protein
MPITGRCTVPPRSPSRVACRYAMSGNPDHHPHRHRRLSTGADVLRSRGVGGTPARRSRTGLVTWQPHVKPRAVEGRAIIVPNHSGIARGTMRSILRQAQSHGGMSSSDCLTEAMVGPRRLGPACTRSADPHQARPRSSRSASAVAVRSPHVASCCDCRMGQQDWVRGWSAL